MNATYVSNGWVMGPFGPQPVIKGPDDRWYLVADAVPNNRPVFSTEAACVAGREPKTRKARKTGKTRAELTHKREED